MRTPVYTLKMKMSNTLIPWFTYASVIYIKEEIWIYMIDRTCLKHQETMF